MKWGEGHWDDPNARWGDPSYLLEPGDPGYVPDPTSASFPATPKKKKGTMPQNILIERGDKALAEQMVHVADNIDSYSATLDLTTAQVNAHKADAARFDWEVKRQQAYLAYAQALTKWKDRVREGSAGDEPELPVLPTEPAAVAPGVETRFRKFVGDMSRHANWSDAIAEALRLLAPEGSRPDPDSIKPAVKTPVVKGDGVMVGWSWNGYREEVDSCEGRVDRGDGQGEQLLTIDTTPGYLDTHPIPSTPQKWTYRWIFRKGDSRIGQWVTVSVNVG
jgi:hypothetical protein